MTELDIDLIDSNEAMLVLNNLPNVQILNGRSTKDEDDEEEDNVEGEEEYMENNENEENINMNNAYNNQINNRNNHLYPQMEEIEEDKNLENNYVSETNNNDNNNIIEDNHKYEVNENNDINGNKDLKTDKEEITVNDLIKNNNLIINNNNIKNDNSYGENNEKEKTNGNNKEKKMTRNINILNEKELNPKIDANSNKESFQPNTLLYDKIISDNSNKKVINSNKDEVNMNLDEPNNNKEKEKESNYDLNNSNNEKNGNFVLDLTNEELNSLKQEKYSENSDLYPLIKEFCDLLNNEANSDGERLQNNFKEKLKTIEDKKGDIPNYYYFYLLYKKKVKFLQNMYNEMFSYIVNKCPEVNKENIFYRLNNELFNTIKDSKDFISILHSHIESYIEKKSNVNNNNNNKDNINNNSNNNINNLNELIKEKDNKISSLEQLRDKLLQNIEEIKLTYEKRISSLEKENKLMTEKIFTKVNNVINATITENQNSIPITERCMTKPNNSSKKKKYMFNNEILNINFINHYNPIRKTKSPIKLTENTNTIENNDTINYYLNTYNNVNTHKQQIIPLKTLKDFINELYLSKSQYDIKCIQFKLPKETLEEHMYTFLNKKYGLKNLIIEWAKNIIAGIKYYSKKDSIVLLFGKIMRNEQEEDARFIIEKVSESIEELLLHYIKRQNPLKLVNEVNKMFERKKKSDLIEEEWKGIIYSIYEKEEAEEIEKKIEIFINKENEKKRREMFQKYKKSRISKQNNNNNNYINTNNSYYVNTITSLNNLSNNNINNPNTSYMNSIGNLTNNNNKLSRVEKYNMLIFSEEKNILFTDFIKIVLDNHIRFRDKQLKNFLELFRSVDTNRDGIINEEEFNELIHKMKIFKEEEVENKIFQFLERLDPFDNQKFTFSECVKFFSGEIIKITDIKGNEKEMSILEKVCFNENKNGNITITNNEKEHEQEQIIESNLDSNKNINNSENNNNDDNINNKS